MCNSFSIARKSVPIFTHTERKGEGSREIDSAVSGVRFLGALVPVRRERGFVFIVVTCASLALYGRMNERPRALVSYK